MLFYLMVCDFNAAEIFLLETRERGEGGGSMRGLFYCFNALCLALFRLGLFLKETGRSARSWRISAVQGRFYFYRSKKPMKDVSWLILEKE